VPVNSTHPDYDAAATEWARARDVLAGEDAVKAGGEKYLPRLDSQTDEEFAAYVQRASYFNASARTSEAYLGLMFRRPPFVKLPADGAGVGRAMSVFQNDADMLGTTLTGYAKVVVGDVIGLGRSGTLVDWEDQAEQRAYVVFYRAEQIINWRVERVNGRNVPTLVVLKEQVLAEPGPDDDGFDLRLVDQMRVLRLVPGTVSRLRGSTTTTAWWSCGSRKRRSAEAQRSSGSSWAPGCRSGWESRCRSFRSCSMGRGIRGRRSIVVRWRTSSR